VVDDQASVPAQRGSSPKLPKKLPKRKGPVAPPATPRTAPATISRHFKSIVWAVFSLTVALLIVRITIGIMVPVPSDALKDVMSNCGLLSNAGFGAILGLVGGKNRS
jgi:hypothetical protein